MEVEKKYTPIFRYETDEDFNDSPTPDYYLLGVPNDNLKDEIKQLILHVFNRFVNEKKGWSIWHFNIHDFLKFQRVTHETKNLILAKFSNTVSWYPSEQIEKYSALIKEIIQTYEGEAKPPRKTFDSNLTDEKITSLYNQLQGNYIDTPIENFKAMFNPDSTIYQPIKRTKKFTNTLLIYFASELFQKNNPDYVSITEYWFNVTGLSQSKENYLNTKTGLPKGYQKINAILESI